MFNIAYDVEVVGQDKKVVTEKDGPYQSGSIR